MEPKALKELVKEVFSDERTRVEFDNNPEAVVSRFKLTETEKKAVLATQMKLGLATPGGVKLDQAVDPAILWSGPIP